MISVAPNATVHDFGEFSAELYAMRYEPPGSPGVAENVAALLSDAGLAVSAAADAMREVLSIAEGTDASSMSALQASEEVGTTAETLRSEVTEFLTAMSSGDESDRRLYERVPVCGQQVVLTIGLQPSVPATVKDISRGGMGLICECSDKVGTDTEVTLPGGGSVSARITRNVNGSVGLAFRQDEASLARIAQALAFVGENSERLAA